jgi:hypothetical protein
MSTTNFFPLHVTEMLIKLDEVGIFNLRVLFLNEAKEGAEENNSNCLIGR